MHKRQNHRETYERVTHSLRDLSYDGVVQLATQNGAVGLNGDVVRPAPFHNWLLLTEGMQLTADIDMSIWG